MNLLHPLNITTFVYKRQNHSRELAAYLNEDDRGGFAARDSATQLKLQTTEVGKECAGEANWGTGPGGRNVPVTGERGGWSEKKGVAAVWKKCAASWPL
ncbi:nitrite reductase large subunit [Sesbania bispinosa]|nr:nitrite reductase large subunit [Sesbania bispinosa]